MCPESSQNKKKLPLFFSFPPSIHLPFKEPWYPWNVLPLERLGRNQEWTPCSLSFPPPPHLKRVLFLFSWGWHAQPSVQLPPASREAANLSPLPPWPQQMSLGGHRGGRGQNRKRLRGEKPQWTWWSLSFGWRMTNSARRRVSSAGVSTRKK